MRRLRRASKTEIDLIGFLDILSAVLVIVLLVISILALSLGAQGAIANSESSSNDTTDVAKSTPAAPEPAPMAEMKTVDGTVITSATAFLLCNGQSLRQFDPSSGAVIDSWDLSGTTPTEVADALRSPNVYLAIAGSCFSSLDDLVQAFRDSGSQLGYEPTSEEAVVPWQ